MTLNEVVDPLPDAKRSIGIKSQIESVIGQIDHGSSYFKCESLSGHTSVGVDVDQLSIAGSVGGTDMDRLNSLFALEGIEELSSRVSAAMASVACSNETPHAPDDADWHFPVYIGLASSVGTTFMLFRDPAVQAMLASHRMGAEGETLFLESRHVEKPHQLKILLGGLAAFLSAVEPT